MELKRYYTILQRRIWAVLAWMVAAAIASYVYASNQPQIFEASSRYLVGSAISNPAVTSNDLRASSQIGQTYAELATSRPIVQEALDRLNLPDDADDVADGITATWIDMPQILIIRVRAADPELAAAISNALGEVLINRSPTGPPDVQAAREEDARARVAALEKRIVELELIIDELGYELQLESQLAGQQAIIALIDQRRADLAFAERSLNTQLTLLQSSSTNQITLIEPAQPRYSPVEPQIERSVVIAALAGAVLGVVLVFLIEYLADAIYTADDLRTTTRLRFLGSTLLERRRRGDSGNAPPDPAVAESYQLLRVGLQTMGVGEEVRTVLIVGASPNDEPSAVAANLARAYASIGTPVTLVDANLRAPQLARHFGLQQEGLASLYTGASETPLLQPVPGVANLSLIAAGAPAALAGLHLEATQTKKLLATLAALPGLVIMNGAPLPSSDALVLASQVQGVILSATSGVSSRESARGAAESLDVVAANVIGIVLNSPKGRSSIFSRLRGSAAKRQRARPERGAEAAITPPIVGGVSQESRR
ncbi:MAG TPA: Wzz/FepE/Etk N-terminal domain-containing protein [Chloroflexaceae bacterium]|nr:Wzz/FepE/Etk N-terminal domain-containing protein [Chloroflexaceae bacterium]